MRAQSLLFGLTLALSACSLDMQGTGGSFDLGPSDMDDGPTAPGGPGGGRGTGGGPGAPDDDDASANGDGDVAIPRFSALPLEVPPSYLGSVNNSSACSQRYSTRGFMPAAQPGSGQRFPLFLYFVGTAFTDADVSASYQSPAATEVTEAMARRGFVALSADYDHGPLAWLSDHKNQLECLFGARNTESLLAKACALPQVDCNLGIATWGHSQGGYVAIMAHNLEPRVRAAWVTGYGGDGDPKLPKGRLRVVNGEADGQNASLATLRTITGLTADECLSPFVCLRNNGSGYIIVRAVDLAEPGSSADHCWFDKRQCTDSSVRLEPNWVDPESDKPFALESNADWVAATARRP